VNRRVLVAGIGNIFLGDDGFGVEVAQCLQRGAVPAHVHVEDFGIRGLHLALELLEGYDALVLVDAVPMDEVPGTVVLLEPEIDADPLEGARIDGADGAGFEAHSMSPTVVFDMLAGLGGHVDRIFIVGCQPLRVDEGIGLSAPVAAAVDRAVEAVVELLAELCAPAYPNGREASP
jgi:hydrogenase maturation protease